MCLKPDIKLKHWKHSIHWLTIFNSSENRALQSCYRCLQQATMKQVYSEFQLSPLNRSHFQISFSLSFVIRCHNLSSIRISRTGPDSWVWWQISFSSVQWAEHKEYCGHVRFFTTIHRCLHEFCVVCFPSRVVWRATEGLHTLARSVSASETSIAVAIVTNRRSACDVYGVLLSLFLSFFLSVLSFPVPTQPALRTSEAESSRYITPTTHR